MEKTFEQLATTIIINELIPRANKLGVGLEQLIIPQDLAILVTAELLGIHNRADTRKYLNQRH